MYLPASLSGWTKLWSDSLRVREKYSENFYTDGNIVFEAGERRKPEKIEAEEKESEKERTGEKFTERKIEKD